MCKYLVIFLTVSVSSDIIGSIDNVDNQYSTSHQVLPQQSSETIHRVEIRFSIMVVHVMKRDRTERSNLAEVDLVGFSHNCGREGWGNYALFYNESCGATYVWNCCQGLGRQLRRIYRFSTLIQKSKHR